MTIREENPLRAAFKTLSVAERTLFEERAAVMEFDGNLSRADANEAALRDVIRRRVVGPR